MELPYSTSSIPEVVDVQPVDVGPFADDRGAEVSVHVVPVDQLGFALGGDHAPAVRPHSSGHSRAHKSLAKLLVVVVGAGRPDALEVTAVLPAVLDQLLRFPKSLVRGPLEVGLGDQLDPVGIQQLHTCP